MRKVPIEHEEMLAQDRLLKPLSEQERQKRVNELLTVREEVKAVLDNNSSGGNGKQ